MLGTKRQFATQRKTYTESKEITFCNFWDIFLKMMEYYSKTVSFATFIKHWALYHQ